MNKVGIKVENCRDGVGVILIRDKSSFHRGKHIESFGLSAEEAVALGRALIDAGESVLKREARER